MASTLIARYRRVTRVISRQPGLTDIPKFYSLSCSPGGLGYTAARKPQRPMRRGLGGIPRGADAFTLTLLSTHFASSPTLTGLVMDVVQLKTLIHVAELGSLSKASDRLHIAQPALSRQIRLLEKELGTYLCDRHGRGMEITDAGREVLGACHSNHGRDGVHSKFGRGREVFFSRHRGDRYDTDGSGNCHRAAGAQNQETHPNLAIRFSSAFSGYLLDWVQRGELELAISYDPQPLHTLRIVPVMMENLLLVGPASANLRLDTPVLFASLAEQQLVLPSARHSLRVILDNCAREVGIKLKTSVEADSFGATIDLVRNGFGLTALPLASIYTQIESGVLSAAPLVDPIPMRKLVQVFPADRRVSPAAKFVGDAFIEIAADLVSREIWAGHML